MGTGLMPNRDVVHCLSIIFSNRSASMKDTVRLSLWQTRGRVITTDSLATEEGEEVWGGATEEGEEVWGGATEEGE